MHIAVIGAGRVGGTLGRRWAQGGHEVVYGVRNPDSRHVQEALEASQGKVRAASVAEAAAEADVVVLATPWGSAKAAVERCGDLSGKILVDCTNPLADGLGGLSVGHDTSAGEMVEHWVHGAEVVKAFNSTGSDNMENPDYGGQAVTMFLCGDNERAKAVVGELAEELGFDVCDAGQLSAARYLEPLALLWIHLAYAREQGTDIAFKLLRR